MAIATQREGINLAVLPTTGMLHDLHNRLAHLRVRALSGPASDRMRARAVPVSVAAVLGGVGGLFAPLLAPAFLAGTASVAVWAALAPAPPSRTASATDRKSGDAAAGDAGRRGTPSERTPPAARSILQALSDPALTLDENLDVLEANAAASEVFGTVRIGRHLSLTSRHPDMAAAVTETVRLGQRRGFTIDLRTPLERQFEGVSVPLDRSAVRPGGAAVLVYLRDLTEQERLSAMRADFVANASHELRTPLASLKGFIETLQGQARNDPAAQERFLEIMNQQAERMTRLIDDLLSLSRIEMRAHLPPSALVDLNEIATSVAAALEPQAKRASITVSVAALAGRAVVRGDHDELIQAVQNLVQNALKYGRSGGHIDIQIHADSPRGAPRLRLIVADDGPGIAPEHLPRLTERFYRVNAATSRERGGTGLGLAIVKHIMARHRGALTIASTVGTGSTFTLEWPAA
jgi:two-component system, OmpR family, phosphate regulon sensor histidine kinase PhoR